jgi:hypothetical protein
MIELDAGVFGGEAADEKCILHWATPCYENLTRGDSQTVDEQQENTDKPIRFAIVSVGRSGSTMLQHLLDSHPAITCYGEAIRREAISDPGDWQRSYSHLQMETYLRDVLFAPHSGPAGMRMMWEHSLEFPETWDVLSRMGFGLILNRRCNRLDLYLSMRLAQTVGDWSSRALYPEARIRVDTEDFLRHSEGWSLMERDISGLAERFPSISVIYEDVRRGVGLDDIQRFIGVEPVPLHTITVRARWQRRDEVIENWDELMRDLSGTPWEEWLLEEEGAATGPNATVSPLGE